MGRNTESGLPPAPAAAPADTQGAVGAAYSRYAIGLLLLLYVLNFLDRQVMSILAEPIKRDLGLADWQIGLMSGLAFAAFYTVVGVPIARLAERSSRPLIIAASAVVWSAFTVFCGMAQNFVQLVLMRVGVGVGEAGCVPASLSLISDYVSKERRALAVAVYMIGPPLGSLLGMIIGGVVAATWGWRMAFMVVGAPGLLAGLLAALTLIEPRRRQKAHAVAPPPPPPAHPFGEVARILWRNRTYRLIVGAVAIKSFINYGLTAFLGSFFLRNHAAELAQTAAAMGLKPLAFLGVALGVAVGVTGVFGTVLGGWLGDWFGARDIRNRAAVPALAVFISTPIYVMSLLAPSMWLSLGLLLIPTTLNQVWSGPSWAIVQGLVVPGMRATASAIKLLIVNLTGLGMGPIGVGLVSDIIGRQLGEAAGVRWSLVSFVIMGLVAGVMFWMCRRSLEADTVS